MCSICVFFSDFSDDSKYLNPSGMICSFSNFQHGTHHGGCTCGMMGGVMGGVTGGVWCDDCISVNTCH